MDLICSFELYMFNTGDTFYQCVIEHQKIPQNKKLRFIGLHMTGKSDLDVTFVEFRDCICPRIPQGLKNYFENLKILGFYNSKLKELVKDDFEDYEDLERFICERNLVKFLPGDLFEGTKKLKYIKFFNNNIEIIEPTILDSLDSLKYANFKESQNYHDFYAEDPIYVTNLKLQELKDSIFNRLFTLDQEVLRNYVQKFPNPNEILKNFCQKVTNSDLKMKILELRFDFYDELRLKEAEEHKKESKGLKMQVEELMDNEAKLRQAIEELRDDKARIEDKLNLKIDNLTNQVESKMLKIRINKIDK
ncbi:unnamed protein product [Chironomus riparius]|uniref:Uncharacterized protein n=1 Tax=Chironomus riparius TaxID=315576 RepID=A0A9N9S6R3_9DIPT|nr:unnamed protein product [Chironomus riparius]